MPRTWLILDVSSLAYRAYYGAAAGDLDDSVCARGLARDVAALECTFGSRNLIFAFDRETSVRKIAYPAYKGNKPTLQSDPVRFREREIVKRQTHLIAASLLPRLGYRNVYSCPGYEADDVIASIVKHSLGGREYAVVVSADRDLYQLLGPGVQVYNPHDETIRDEDGFRATYGVPPADWPMVRAISGDESDNIPGVAGVAELTAARYVAQKLNPTTLAYRRIHMWVTREQYRLNRRLIELPYPGTPAFIPAVHPAVAAEDWDHYINPNAPRGIPCVGTTTAGGGPAAAAPAAASRSDSSPTLPD
jgi:hypothetical protein